MGEVMCEVNGEIWCDSQAKGGQQLEQLDRGVAALTCPGSAAPFFPIYGVFGCAAALSSVRSAVDASRLHNSIDCTRHRFTAPPSLPLPVAVSVATAALGAALGCRRRRGSSRTRV
ncbi:hypothetical protein E2562_025457 [Oryza meyeriana var. granulata]|uniref:Uncharacterized protein n=1 Tax=Oryza meyeriana var. granulata TaxID=110450 RepID=A0A6G1D6R8_9ORYZ|nr:hypothetical protein E2562_025457 [Oryza meyeriana var. granulata]